MQLKFSHEQVCHEASVQAETLMKQRIAEHTTALEQARADVATERDTVSSLRTQCEALEAILERTKSAHDTSVDALQARLNDDADAHRNSLLRATQNHETQQSMLMKAHDELVHNLRSEYNSMRETSSALTVTEQALSAVSAQLAMANVS